MTVPSIGQVCCTSFQLLMKNGIMTIGINKCANTKQNKNRPAATMNVVLPILYVMLVVIWWPPVGQIT